MPECAAPRNLITRRCPCLARNAQHGALARSGKTNNDTKTAAVGDMRKRIALLARKDKTALRSPRQCCLAMGDTYRVSLVQIDTLCRAVKGLFGLYDLPGGETVFAAPVLAEFDQSGCVADAQTSPCLFG